MSARVASLALVVLVVLSPPVLAERFTSPSHYFSITVPDTWARESVSGVDAVWVGPIYSGFSANVNVLAMADASARNTESWLLQGAQAGFQQVMAQYGARPFQNPRSFTTSSGRPAADYVLDYDGQGTPLRIRQVLFASDVRDFDYILTFTAHRDHFPSLGGVWTGIVDSFAVDEPAASLFVFIGIGAAVGAAVVAVIVAVAVHRHRKALASLPPPAPFALDGPPVGAPPATWGLPPTPPPPGNQPPLPP